MKRTLGVCYYPEHWPEEQWATDAAQMVDDRPDDGSASANSHGAGWNPAPDTFTWDWLDRAVEVLGQRGT